MEERGGPWQTQLDDGGLFVFHKDEYPRLAIGGDIGHQTELAAWEYGLNCLLQRRDHLAKAITDARAEVRRLKRKGS